MNISKRSGIPSLLLFLLLGILCSFTGIRFENYILTEEFATIALLIIIFYGGFGTNWKMGKTVVREAVVLSSLGVIATAFITGLFVHFLLSVPWLESLLLGSIISSTDFASVSNILSSKNLNLKYHTASLLELESGSNDPMAYTLTIIFLTLLSGEKTFLPFVLVRQVVLGLAGGFILAFFVSQLIHRINLQKDGLINLFIFSMAFFTYSLTDSAGGNGYLAVYIFGIYIGNKTFIAKKEIIFFFDGVSGLMNIGLFFLLGLLANPIEVLRALPVALLLMAFITFIGRPLSVFGLLLPFKLKRNQLAILSWAGLRGAAAITFAIMSINSGLSFSINIYHIVFGICLLSSLIQGTLMPLFSRKLQMIDPDNKVMRTFNYYVGKGNITFMKSEVTEDSKFAGHTLMEVSVERDFIVAKVIRGNEALVPRGDLLLQKGDILIWSGEEYFDPVGQDLLEFSISQYHEWAGKRIMELHLPKTQLIISIEREGKRLPAIGDTRLEVGDRILLYDSEKSVQF